MNARAVVGVAAGVVGETLLADEHLVPNTEDLLHLVCSVDLTDDDFGGRCGFILLEEGGIV